LYSEYSLFINSREVLFLNSPLSFKYISKKGCLKIQKGKSETYIEKVQHNGQTKKDKRAKNDLQNTTPLYTFIASFGQSVVMSVTLYNIDAPDMDDDLSQLQFRFLS
jgi:hypothetical protein